MTIRHSPEVRGLPHLIVCHSRAARSVWRADSCLALELEQASALLCMMSCSATLRVTSNAEARNRRRRCWQLQGTSSRCKINLSISCGNEVRALQWRYQKTTPGRCTSQTCECRAGEQAHANSLQAAQLEKLISTEEGTNEAIACCKANNPYSHERDNIEAGDETK